MNTRHLARPAWWLVLALTALLALAASGELRRAVAETPSASGSPDGDAPVVLRIGWNQKLDSLNPFIGYESVSYEVYHLNYDYLTDADDKTLEPVPALATEWSSSDDLRTWTFKLRRGVTWQDGEPFTAADVVFTYEFNKTDEISNYDMYIGGIDSCEALDDHTVRFTCSRPSPGILRMRMPIVPKHIWSKMTPAEAARKFQNPGPVIGTGPFQVVEFERDKYVRMKANPDFWGGAAKVDEIIFQMYTNNDTLTSDLRAGLIVAGNVQPAAYRTLKEVSGLTTTLSTDPGFDELGFNCYDSDDSLGNPVLRDPAFRRAVAWAIDRDKIAAIAWDGFAEPATSIIPANFYDPSLDYHWEPSADQARTYDPAKCRQLLDAAGYEDSDGDGIREDKDGKPIKLRLWSASDKPQYAAAGKFITGWLEDVGLDITMQVLEDGALSDRQYNYTKDGAFAPDFDLFIWGWVGDLDPNFLLSLFTTDQIEAWSDCDFSDPDYDAMYTSQDQDGDSQSRLQTIHEMQALLYDQCPYIPLVYPLSREVYSSAWQGWVKQPAANGSIWNRYTYLSVHPETATAKTSDSSNGAIVVAGVVAAGIGAGALFFGLRRRSSRTEEEAD